MSNINFTDWQDLWLKKDVEKIEKRINSYPEFRLSVVIGLIVNTLSLLLLAGSLVKQDEGRLIPFIITLAVIAVGAPLVIFLKSYIGNICEKIRNIKNNDIPIKEYVSIFDNKICNSAMMADSLFEHMKKETDPPAKYYCICEINYYINKCINELFAMVSMKDQIFIDKDRHVSPKRLRLVIKLLNALRVQTYKEMMAITKKDEMVEEYIINEIKKHDCRIIAFISMFNRVF